MLRPPSASLAKAWKADESGNLYAGGEFLRAGEVAASRIARWDGATWHAVGEPLNGGVTAITTYGGSVYVGGDFTTAGDLIINGIARWDGVNWIGFGSGANDDVDAIAAIGSQVYVGGSFDILGGHPSNNFGVWGGEYYLYLWLPVIIK